MLAHPFQLCELSLDVALAAKIVFDNKHSTFSSDLDPTLEQTYHFYRTHGDDRCLWKDDMADDLTAPPVMDRSVR